LLVVWIFKTINTKHYVLENWYVSIFR
jgi:hypothetical protein